MPSIKQNLVVYGPVIVVAVLGVVLSHLKTQTVTQFSCLDSTTNGTTCEVCTSKFKNCRGHQVFEPYTVSLCDSFLTIVIGSCVTLQMSRNIREATTHLFDLSAMKTIGFVGALYALGDVFDMYAAGKVSGTTLLVTSQFRLPMCALLRSWLLGKGQTVQQWLVLVVILSLCLCHLASEVFPDARKSKSDDGFFKILLWTSGKSIIGVFSAIQAEWLYVDSGNKREDNAKQTPAVVKQVHFKTATLLGSLVIGYVQGRRGGRIFANEWRTELFDKLPAGVNYGDPRTPFFGGWDYSTWALVACNIFNSFTMGYLLRYLTSVSKYTAAGLSLVLSYCGQLLYGTKALDILPALCCVCIAYSTIHYAGLEESEKQRKMEKQKELEPDKTKEGKRD